MYLYDLYFEIIFSSYFIKIHLPDKSYYNLVMLYFLNASKMAVHIVLYINKNPINYTSRFPHSRVKYSRVKKNCDHFLVSTAKKILFLLLKWLLLYIVITYPSYATVPIKADHQGSRKLVWWRASLSLQ